MATTLVPSNFQPHFKRVSAGEDRHADVYCAIASLAGNGKTLDDIRKQAETLGVPKTGPYYPYIDGDLIAKLLAAHGLVATVWKESKDFKDLTDVAIAMVPLPVFLRSSAMCRSAFMRAFSTGMRPSFSNSDECAS